MRFLLSSLFVACIAVVGWAVDISGKWSGTIELKLPDGNIVSQPAWAEFTQNGQELSGTAGGGDSDESLPIEQGVFHGSKIKFQFTGQDGRVYKASLSSAGEDCFEGTLDFVLPDGTSMTANLTLKREEKH